MEITTREIKRLHSASQERALGLVEAEARDYTLRQRNEAIKRVTELTRNDADSAQIDKAFADVDRWAARGEDFTRRIAKRRESARIVREPLTYSRHSEHSYFADLAHAEAERDGEASARLAKHEQELRVELKARTTLERRNRGDELPPDVHFERRAGGGMPESVSRFAPPLWLLDLAAVASRPERVLADLVPSYLLQKGFASVNVPRLTTGTMTGTSAPGAAVASRDFTDALASSPVVQFSGFSDFPEAMVEQLPMGAAALDLLLWRDLLNDTDAQLEAMMVAGRGEGLREFTGLENAGGEVVTYTSGAPTAIGAYKSLGEAFGTVSDNRKIRPECWVMRGGRWAFFVTGEDEEKRPLGVPAAQNPAPITPDGVPDPVGALVGIPVFTSESISTTLGGVSPEAGNEDTIIATRPSDLLLWESAPTVGVIRDSAGVSGTIGVRATLRKSAAFIATRYPAATCTVNGTGLVVPTNE